MTARHPSTNAVHRIRRSVKWTESQRADFAGPNRGPIFRRSPRPGFLAIITAHTQISPNRWTYQWTEAKHAPAATFTPKPGGRNSETYGPAYNTFESNNNGTGLEGSGDNFTTLPGGLTLNPIGIGAVIEITLRTTCDGSLEPIFTAPNNVGGTCP